MDELKACPFCGSSNTTLDYYEISCPQELGTIVVCNDCGASAKSIVDWNNRPIEDALLKRAERAEATVEKLIEANEDVQSRLDDYRNDVSRVLDEKCPSDERHCGCVPILRDQLNKYQKALILITTMPELSQATTIAREALQERGKFIWTEQSVGEYWVTKLDILQDKFDTLEKDYADVCQKRLEAADVFSRQIIELESENAELEAALVSSGNQQGLHLEELLDLRPRIAELESTIERLIEAGKRLLDSLCTDPEEEKTVEVMNWKAVVDKVNKERER